MMFVNLARHIKKCRSAAMPMVWCGLGCFGLYGQSISAPLDNPSIVSSIDPLWKQAPDLQGDKRFGINLSATSINWSDPVAISDIEDWEDTDFQPGRHIFTKQAAFTGIRRGNTEVGVTGRYHYYLSFSEDTARWHYLEENDQIDDVKETFDVFLKANNVRGGGYYLAQTFSYPNIDFFVRLSHLNLNRLTYGTAEGVYDPALHEGNQTDLIVDYAYTEERILNREVASPRGKGWVLDLGVEWQWEKHYFKAQVDEAYTHLQWDAAPTSVIQSQFARWNQGESAAIEFRELYTELTQTLPAHIQLNYQYQIGRDLFSNKLLSSLTLGIERESIDTLSWNRLALSFTPWGRLNTTLSWSQERELYGLRIEHPWFYLSVEADSEDPRVANVRTGIKIRF